MDTNSWGVLIAIAVLFFALGFLVGLAMQPKQIALRPGPIYTVPEREHHAPRDPKTGRYMKRSALFSDPADPISVLLPMTIGNAKLTGIADEHQEH